MTPNNIIELLQMLIATPSFSREEEKTADIIESYLWQKNFVVHRYLNNVWVKSYDFQENKPTILLNSHHDTVQPNAGYTRSPFEPIIEDGKLYGLGSNDAGGALVALLETFCRLSQTEQPYNLIYAATAEEEISGANGISAILPLLGKIDLGIVGEPTNLQMAVAEKGLIVLDCIAHGKAAHAARNEGINAIYQAMTDIEWFRTYQFPKISPTLGAVKMTVTMIEAGKQHNIIPDICRFTVDIRTTDSYSNLEIVELIQKHVKCEVKPRSLRLNSSRIPMSHPVVQRGIKIGLSYFGSPTLSDQALMPFPTLKIGPGDSARSHIADEYIQIEEIWQGVEVYCKLLDKLQL
ncbi:MAG: M20 family metallo-hydrolase [Cytophagales bacterium]|nr:M20 family metallo-hydrolase [Cytophagales bacterium]MDW8384407.1 M20 family metallo-hydrolase [Flammeovirgaceae bacterium]